MAVTCTFLDVSWLLVNVYCPSTRADKSAFYQPLQSLQLPEGPILTGGDFNACAHDYDRSHGLTSATTCPDLIRWEDCWDIADGLCSELNEETNDDSRVVFAAKHHTYHYSVDGQLRSARLDRWYTSVQHAAWVNEVVTLVPGAPSDHLSVRVVLQHPDWRPTTKRARHTLARSPCIIDLQTAVVAAFLVHASPSFLAITDTQEIIDAWETIKVAARTLCFKVAAQGRRRQRQSYRHRLKQLERRYREAVCFAVRQRDEAGTVQGITKGMAALALVEPGVIVSRIHGRIVALKRQRARHMTRRQRARYRGSGTSSTKTFFARFSVKYAAKSAVVMPGTCDEQIAAAVEKAWNHHG